MSTYCKVNISFHFNLCLIFSIGIMQRLFNASSFFFSFIFFMRYKFCEILAKYSVSHSNNYFSIWIGLDVLSIQALEANLFKGQSNRSQAPSLWEIGKKCHCAVRRKSSLWLNRLTNFLWFLYCAPDSSEKYMILELFFNFFFMKFTKCFWNIWPVTVSWCEHADIFSKLFTWILPSLCLW